MEKHKLMFKKNKTIAIGKIKDESDLVRNIRGGFPIPVEMF